MDARIHSTEVRTRIISNALAESRQPTGIDEVLLIVLAPDAHTYVREGVSGFDNVPVRTFVLKKSEKLQDVFATIQTSMQKQLCFEHVGSGIQPALLKNLKLGMLHTLMGQDEALIFTTTLRAPAPTDLTEGSQQTSAVIDMDVASENFGKPILDTIEPQNSLSEQSSDVLDMADTSDSLGLHNLDPAEPHNSSTVASTMSSGLDESHVPQIARDTNPWSTDIRDRVHDNVLEEHDLPSGAHEVWFVILLLGMPVSVSNEHDGASRSLKFKDKKTTKLRDVFARIQECTQMQLQFQHVGSNIPTHLLENLPAGTVDIIIDHDGVLFFKARAVQTTLIGLNSSCSAISSDSWLSTFGRPLHIQADGNLNMWPPQSRHKIATVIALKLTELSHFEVPVAHIEEQLNRNPKYSELLETLELYHKSEDRMTIAKHLASHAMMPVETRDYLQDLIDEVISLEKGPSERNVTDSIEKSIIDPPDEHEFSPATQLQISPESGSLQQLDSDTTLSTLESQVKARLEILARLSDPLKQFIENKKAATQWVSQIQDIEQLNIVTPTIIGVMGSTGAGKSSIINALIDEERLLPTNCMQACTAVVTTISWNSCEEAHKRYRARIDFISKESWKKELDLLFQEILDSGGRLSKECQAADSEAGIAYAKIRAVYPNKTDEVLAKSDTKTLLGDKGVQAILGGMVSIEAHDVTEFCNKIQKYIDSASKSSRTEDKTGSIGYWPLIKEVQIYTRSDALSTGGKIVDLPGIHDSNAARSAVASKYMKQCTGFWVVSPITRAVDDKAAKTLLDRSFQRQLQYDGSYSRMTWICSKTDDVSVVEASASLGLDEQTRETGVQLDALSNTQAFVEEQLDELKRAIQDEANSNDLLAGELDTWKALRTQFECGQPVFSPSKKRKRLVDVDSPRKGRIHGLIPDLKDNKNNSLETDDVYRVEPLSMAMIEAKIASIEDSKAHNERHELYSVATILRLGDIVRNIAGHKAKMEENLKAVCIQGRNQYSTAVVRRGYAAGIKDLDQETQAQEDEENFDPDQEMRDYDELAQSLPVFCVSSRAYQKLSGRFERDSMVAGFATHRDTQIPQLQAYCKKLTEASRISDHRRLINRCDRVINSVVFWVEQNPKNFHMSDAEQKVESRYMNSKLKSLKEALSVKSVSCLRAVDDSLTRSIYSRFGKAIALAAGKADTTARSWEADTRIEGIDKKGIHWSTYKAVVRRDGIFGRYDFNYELVEPIITHLSSTWESCFSRHVPGTFMEFSQEAIKSMKTFHADVLEHAKIGATSTTGVMLLAKQLPLYEATLQETVKILSERVDECQKTASRCFTPEIASSLGPTYSVCASQTGPGSFTRMKFHLRQHIDTHKKPMFTKVTTAVKSELTLMRNTIATSITEQINKIFSSMQDDYLSVITRPQTWTPREIKLRAHIADILRNDFVAQEGSCTTIHEETTNMQPMERVAIADVSGSAIATATSLPALADLSLEKPVHIKHEAMSDTPASHLT